MGCASSSPLTVNGGPGGLVETTKTAATEIMNTGEKAMNGNFLMPQQVTHKSVFASFFCMHERAPVT